MGEHEKYYNFRISCRCQKPADIKVQKRRFGKYRPYKIYIHVGQRENEKEYYRKNYRRHYKHRYSAYRSRALCGSVNGGDAEIQHNRPVGRACKDVNFYKYNHHYKAGGVAKQEKAAP
jgi:hypothetical protein